VGYFWCAHEVITRVHKTVRPILYYGSVFKLPLAELCKPQKPQVLLTHRRPKAQHHWPKNINHINASTFHFCLYNFGKYVKQHIITKSKRFHLWKRLLSSISKQFIPPPPHPCYETLVTKILKIITLLVSYVEEHKFWFYEMEALLYVCRHV